MRQTSLITNVVIVFHTVAKVNSKKSFTDALNILRYYDNSTNFNYKLKCLKE